MSWLHIYPPGVALSGPAMVILTETVEVDQNAIKTMPKISSLVPEKRPC